MAKTHAILILGFLAVTACGSDGGGAGDDSGGGNSGSGGNSGGSGGGGGTPVPIDSGVEAGSCGLDNPAFCETFETRSEGGRAGPLDESKWSFARWGHTFTQFFVRLPADSQTDNVYPSTFCGQEFSGIVPYADVELCPGVGVSGQTSNQLNEVFDDVSGFGFNSMRIRQMIDFTDAPVTIVFDVDAKINPHNIGHGWWIELFVTEDPSPMPYHGAPTVASYPRNGIGFAFQGFSGCQKNANLWGNELNRLFVTREYDIIHDNDDFTYRDVDARCFKTADGELNRFRFVISRNEVEVFASDHDDPTNLRSIAYAPDLDLNFTRGYVHIQHAQYNANKDGDVTSAQTYRWDNVGFDGPAYAMPRAYEVADNDRRDNEGEGGRVFGYDLNNGAVTVQVEGVDLEGATRATFNFNVFTEESRVLQYRFNGGEWHEYSMPDIGEPEPLLRTGSVEVALSELLAGTNSIELQGEDVQIANMELEVSE